MRFQGTCVAVMAVCSAVAGTRALPAADEGAAVEALPGEVDLRKQFSDYELPPRSQGGRNTCSVFTTVGALEFALAKHNGKGQPLSAEYLNWACNQVIGNKSVDRGQFFHHLLEAFEKHGACPDADMPYAKQFEPELAPSAAAVERAAAVRAVGFQVHWIKHWRHADAGLTAAQFRDVQQVLAQGYPVAAGSSHSRLLVGYRSDPAAAGGGVFYARDSGVGQYNEVSYEFVRAKINDAFWIEPPGPAPPAVPK